MAKWQNFQETFDGNILNAGRWSGAFGTVTASGGAMNLVVNTGASNYAGIDSTTNDLTDSYCSVRLVNAGNQALASIEVYIIQLLTGSTSKLTWYMNAGTLKCLKVVSSVQLQVGSSLAYNATLHQYFRIREKNGFIYYDYSADGITWTNQASVATPITITALFYEPSAGTFATEASGTTVIIDNINLIPSNAPGNRLVNITVGDGMGRSEGAT